ncbi:WecB/TagA/CpsF family glycosyltransferase [Microbulbifer sp. S227A]|uniref:WecB/TagA/CpsF family glycosyltransferase n=1 Tax=Microbulbifer sp. S227A TaxID=3415131 RepID=UPI003C7BCF5F
MKHTDFQTEFALSAPVVAACVNTRRISALGLDLVDDTAEQTIAAVLAPGRRRVFFMNAHCCNIQHRNAEYDRAVARADLLLPDGIGVELAGKMRGEQLSSNLNGTDFVPRMLIRAAQMGKSVFLFGGKPGTAEAAARRLLIDTPGLRVAGTRDGYDGAANTEAAIAEINASGADIVLVALGVPTQELWLHRNADRLTASLTMGVGALFDFLAGNVARAPRLVRKARMEWGWRLAMEPRRMARRYLLGNLEFMARAAWRAVAIDKGAALQQRLLDLVVSCVALILLAPVLLLTMLAVRLDSRGPALFAQTRVGRDGRLFTLYKFRSMHIDAEDRRAALLSTSDREGICFKSRNDPRITRVGRFIRRFSIDELPQIINVFKGEMSIVGPRPALPSEVAAYPPRALGRLAVKPGITGVWQVSGRADIPFDRMIEMDIEYAGTRNLVMDILLILMTFRAVVSGRGAY